MDFKKEHQVRFQTEEKSNLGTFMEKKNDQKQLPVYKNPDPSWKFEGGYKEKITKFGKSKVYPEGLEPERRTILDPGSDTVLKWNRIFLFFCLVGLFMDPLFFYLPCVVNQGKSSCMQRDLHLGIIVTCFRTVADVFYLIHMVVKFRTAYVAPSSRVFGKGELVMDLNKIAKRYLKSQFFVDLIAALPLPQIVIWSILPAIRSSHANHTNNALVLIVLLQYIPRLYLIFPLSSQIIKATGVVTKTAWAGAAYNLLLYMLASHVLGASWYLLSIERHATCWKSACMDEFNSTRCSLQFLDCGTLTHSNREIWMNKTLVFTKCNPDDTSFFNYDIWKCCCKQYFVFGICREVLLLFVVGSTELKAPFLSLNLNALAGQLAKAKLSKRCFLDPDLFPLELLNTEYGGLKKVAMESSAHMAAAKNQIQQISTPSNVLALPGPDTNDMQKVGLQKDLVISSTGQPKGPIDVGVQGRSTAIVSGHVSSERNLSTSAIMERIPSRWPRPVWHAPWKNYRVISGHLGWVRSVAVDPSNTWFCTGSADRTIKIWDLASGRLRLTLTGHIDQVRGLAISSKHTYMFSAGDDKLVKCWDLEQNKAIRSYHGHLSGVYCLALHPTIDILLTGGRDSVCRVWDIRSKMQIHALSGHENTVCSVFTRPTDPQVITGSHDSTIKLWDLRYGKTMATLTHHKKSVRAMAPHPTEDCFVSASAENIKKFKLPKGEFMHNMLSPQKTIINAAAVNEEGVLATAGDNGSLWFWDWKSGHNFQQAQTIVQPGSLDSEAGIYAITYDLTGSRLITCEADKTIKMWKEDDMATPETHPLHFKPPKDMRRF